MFRGTPCRLSDTPRWTKIQIMVYIYIFIFSTKNILCWKLSNNFLPRKTRLQNLLTLDLVKSFKIQVHINSKYINRVRVTHQIYSKFKAQQKKCKNHNTPNLYSQVERIKKWRLDLTFKHGYLNSQEIVDLWVKLSTNQNIRRNNELLK